MIPLRWAVNDRCLVSGRLGRIIGLVTIRNAATREQRALVRFDDGGPSAQMPTSALELAIMMRCPQCHAEHVDHDGFGFVAHVKPGFADGCGWCSHPSRDGNADGTWICGICGDVETAEQQLATICGSKWVDGKWVHYRGHGT